MKRALLVLCLTLAACGDAPGDDTAQGACRAYGEAASVSVDGAELRATALERAQRAAEADNAYAALPGDLTDAWSRADAMAAAHNSGQEVTGSDLDAYAAADRLVRADCAKAGEDLPPLQP